MGKATGFLEFPRQNEGYEPVVKRVKHYKEFVFALSDSEAKVQGARCMDCGIPFCNNGCPVNNIIPDFNDLVYRQDWKSAIEVLHQTNNFPEFTGRICPAPCEAACTLGINELPVGIKSIEHAIIDKAWEEGWVAPQVPKHKTGKTVAVVGSGPAGMAAAQQLARAGHDVTVFEKNDRVGGLLRYGIPDFKMEKDLIDRRIEQMQAEGVTFRAGVMVTDGALPAGIKNYARETISAQALMDQFDAVVLAGGSEVPRDLPVPGRELAGVHYALEFLIPQNKEVAGDGANDIRAEGKHVIVIGGGDTGSDCVGTSNRHGAESVTQFELLPQPPEEENKPLVWPYWPIKLRTSSSHDEGCSRDWSVATKELMGENGKVTALKACRVEWKDGKMQEVPGSEFVLKADLVLLAMGFTNPVGSMLKAFGVDTDARKNAKAATEGDRAYQTNVPKVFAAGDVRRGQSLVVWAIREGRQAARSVDAFLMGHTELPR
ncbi:MULTISPECIES: glutamate synthase subunit beta [unclassified Cupriavidus]|uniref:glutamate synthase subunit beta n=1 Tax=unclassified Cupriavidus TaxID=2640874 RepID=UPI001C002BC8|nr:MULTISPECIES: glutamate synthase subunit beta [unclassified Cupriavidus]MCA3187972.1 glutamate synthase subunit beta [Cupriavidus sp.]MCA3193230.1 glutamate synthase subunit beta [Cupriavidus sp.]MCA3194676.1 glutamate synthase subunit beta [Cupriavidus sp.]MCA3203056.1 glutamate synthase subunit beta [Cupriavidus sp.]MCA3207608.1 glutamate synthase subunit beta [Cupriavidus sp.]